MRGWLLVRVARAAQNLGDKVRHLLALTLALVSVAEAHAQIGARGDISFTGDSDRFYSYRERIGALWSYQSYLDYRGIAAQATHYTQAGWHQDGQGLIGFWRQQKRTTLTGINAEGGVVRVAGHTRAVGDATWGWRPGAHTGVELIAAGDLVETQAAINRGVAYGFYGASIEQQLVPRLTAIGLVGYQPFTDGNERAHLRARLIWDAIPAYGITAQVRWRQYRSSEEDVGRAYFNPQQYRQWQAAVAMRKRMAHGWIFSGTLAGGQETINNDRTQPTSLAELRLEGPVAGEVRLVLHALYTRSTGYVDSPNYWYAQFGASLLIPF